MEPGRKTLGSTAAGMGVEAPGQPRLSRRKIRPTIVDGCTHADGSLENGGITSIQDVVGVKPDKRRYSPLVGKS